MNITLKDVVINYEAEFKKLIPQMRRAAKRLKHTEPRTKKWHKENQRMYRLMSDAAYLQYEFPKREDR